MPAYELARVLTASTTLLTFDLLEAAQGERRGTRRASHRSRR